VFARVSLREPPKLDQLGLGRFQREAEPSQPIPQCVLKAQSILAILEAHHKVVDIPHEVGLPSQARFSHALEP
jgi:hypothetical protein